MKNKNYVEFIAVILFVLLCVRVLAEMPPEPKLEELCKDSNIIVIGEFLKEEKIRHTFNYSYKVALFEAKEFLKGKAKTDPSIPDGKKTITILLQDSHPEACGINPKYIKGEKYVLFLGQKILGNIYLRSELDRMWGERKALENIINDLIKIIGNSK